MKVAVVGEEITIQPFSALGQEVYPAENREEASQILSQLNLSQYALIILTPEVAGVQKQFPGPNYLVLPSLKNRDAKQNLLIEEVIRRATGR